MALDPPPEVPRFRAWVWSLPGGAEVSAFIDQVRAYLKSPSEKAAELVREGWNEIDRHEFPRAIARLDEAIRLDPSSAEAHLARGSARGYLDDDACMADFDEAIRLDPGEWHAYHYRGLVYLYANDPWPAIDAFTRTIADFPARPEPYVKRASAWLAVGDSLAARADAESALARGESREALRIWLTSLACIGEDSGLLSILDAEIRADPSEPDHHIRRAMLLATSRIESVRNPQEALASARRAEALGEGRSRAALRALAVANASAGDYPKAVRCSFLAMFRGMPYRYMETDLAYLATFLARRPYRAKLWSDHRPDRRAHRLTVGLGISGRIGAFLKLDLDHGFALRAVYPRGLPLPMFVLRWNPKGLREFLDFAPSPEGQANALAPRI